MVTVCLSSSRNSKAPGNYRVLLGSTQLYQHAQEVSVIQIIMLCLGYFFFIMYVSVVVLGLLSP